MPTLGAQFCFVSNCSAGCHSVVTCEMERCLRGKERTCILLTGGLCLGPSYHVGHLTAAADPNFVHYTHTCLQLIQNYSFKKDIRCFPSHSGSHLYPQLLGGERIRDQPQLHIKLGVNLSYRKPCL